MAQFSLVKLQKTAITILTAVAFCLPVIVHADETEPPQKLVFAQNSVLASGKWVKIKVDQTGIQAITHERLSELGFSKPELVRVYGSGCLEQRYHQFWQMSDDLTPTATLHTGGKLYFFGEGAELAKPDGESSATVSRSLYVTYSTYFLHQEEAAWTDTPHPYGPPTVASDPVRDALYIEGVKPETQSYYNGGTYYQGQRLAPGQSEVHTFEYHNLSPDVSTNKRTVFAYASYGFHHQSTDAVSEPDFTIPSDYEIITGDCRPCEPIPVTYPFSIGSRWYRAVAPANDGTIDLTLTCPVNYTTDGTPYCALESAYLLYRTELRPNGRDCFMPFFFNMTNKRNIDFVGFPEDTKIWHVANNGTVTPVETKYFADAEEPYHQVLSPEPFYPNAARLVAWSPSGTYPEPEYLGDVTNQNIHAMPVPDMVIVTTATLEPQARELAEIHRTLQNLDVLVLVQDNIYNEFSGGSRTPQGIRKMAKMFHDRDYTNRFRYLLLYGATIYDHRFLNYASADLLPTYEAEQADWCMSSSRNFGSDVYFAMLGDEFTHSRIGTTYAQLSVGRLPVRNASSARQVNAKIASFITNPPAAASFQRAVFYSDQGDQCIHYMQNTEIMDTMTRYNPRILPIAVDKACFTPGPDGALDNMTEFLSAQMRRGIGFLSYTGHGSEVSLSGQVWTNRLTAITDNEEPFFGMLSTCRTYTYDDVPNSMAEEWVLKPKGGMIACVAANRSVFMSYNKMVNNTVGRAYALATPGTTYGDLWLTGRNYFIATDCFGTPSTFAAINTMSYNLCGDPAVPIPLPDYEVQVESVAGTAPLTVNPETLAEDPHNVDYSALPKLTPYAATTVRGRVVASDGGQVDNFSGKGLLEIYGAAYPRIAPQNPAQSNYIGKSYDTGARVVSDSLLVEVPVDIVNGAFSAEITVPYDRNFGKANRMMLSFSDTEGKRAAGTCFVSVTDGPMAPENSDSRPSVDKFYLGSDDFVNGSMITGDIRAYASVSTGDVPLMTSAFGLSSGTQVRIDGSTNYTGKITGNFDTEGNYIISFNVDNLSDGYHTLELTVHDVAGESATATLDFLVNTSAGHASLSTGESAVVRENVEFTLDHNYTDAEPHRLIVRNAAGETVFSSETPAFPYLWDFRGNDGEYVPDGVYTAVAMIKAGSAFGATEPTEFIVVRKPDLLQ